MADDTGGFSLSADNTLLYHLLFLPRCSRDGKSRAFHLKNPMLIFMKFRGEQLLLKSQEGQWLLFFCDGRYFPFFMTLHSNEMNVSATVVFSSDSIFLLITL